MHARGLFLAICCLLTAMPQDALAKPKSKKVREKEHPNYQRYLDDAEYKEGKASRLTGILLTSIGGGVGGSALIGGILYNTCIGSTEEQRPKCQRNARSVIAAGVIITGASLGFGIPMITVGREKMDTAKRRIDSKFPVKPTDDADEATVPERDDWFVAVRVFNHSF